MTHFPERHFWHGGYDKADFDPASTVPVPAGGFVRRVALTPHYDGVKADGAEPAVIAICGMAPVGQTWLEADRPGWRKV
jgi:hypothetical protein